MRLQEILSQSVNNLYSMRDEVSMEMIEAKGAQLKKLQTKLGHIEEAIYLKESGYEENDTNQEA